MKKMDKSHKYAEQNKEVFFTFHFFKKENGTQIDKYKKKTQILFHNDAVGQSQK